MTKQAAIDAYATFAACADPSRGALPIIAVLWLWQLALAVRSPLRLIMRPAVAANRDGARRDTAACEDFLS